MGLKQRENFCRHLAGWLFASEWHFTTLLAAAIESIDPLPDDLDQLVNDILRNFSSKPSLDEIYNYLETSKRIRYWWYGSGVTKPRITSYWLNNRESAQTYGNELPLLADRKDVARWLGLTPNQLNWLADSWRSETTIPQKYRHYHYSLARKRHGGYRLIESPKRLLRQIQRQINEQILMKIPVHEAAHGFRRHRSCLTHAGKHSGKRYLILYDIAHCFQSVEWYSVYRVFCNAGYSEKIASYLACLCTHRIDRNNPIMSKLDQQQRERCNIRHLPQGAPSSPALSNIILFRLDNRLSGLADRLRLNYSRYADDLAFSGNQKRNWRFLEPLIGSICLEEGFELNFHKSRILKSHQRQKLTGIVVNDKINFDRREYDRLKAILYNCVNNGLDSQNRHNHEDFRAHLLGRINYVSILNSTKGKKLRAMFDQIPKG